jgi:AraC-like DNA-binding protein
MSIEDEKIHIVIPEGGTNNYINGFKTILGGIESENKLLVEKGPVELQLNYHTIEGVEFLYLDLITRKPLLIIRTPDNNPNLLHINIIKEAAFKRKYKEDKSTLVTDSKSNVFLYNALFPVEGDFPANTKLRYLGFKIDLTSMGPIFEGMADVFTELFGEEEALAYHAELSGENDRLISDIFAFNDLANGKVPLISARALEVLTNIVLHFKSQVDMDELAGLHIADYNMLNEVKKKIISNLDTSFTIEELSKEFGVSPTKLKMDFKHLFGATIYKFYNQARMDEAYRRLKSGQYSVSEVGYDLGYSSLSKFSSMFKKVHGILPNDVVKANPLK